jgi:hypothetical protein
MAYMRHRSRSIQESVFQDLQDTLIACRWMAGTTKQVVADPDTGNVGIITRLEADVYPITDENPIELLDYFPEPGTATALNTFAVDVAQPGESDEWELGSNMRTQPYLFGFVLFASSDAVAVAVMNDLADRYFGRIWTWTSSATRGMSRRPHPMRCISTWPNWRSRTTRLMTLVAKNSSPRHPSNESSRWLLRSSLPRK